MSVLFGWQSKRSQRPEASEIIFKRLDVWHKIKERERESHRESDREWDRYILCVGVAAWECNVLMWNKSSEKRQPTMKLKQGKCALNVSHLLSPVHRGLQTSRRANGKWQTSESLGQVTQTVRVECADSRDRQLSWSRPILACGHWDMNEWTILVCGLKL